MRHTTQRYMPNAQGDRALRAFARYPYMTADQVTLAAGYAVTSKARVWTALKRLTDATYTFKDELPDKHGGNPAGVWSLLTRGRTYLAQRGIATLPRVKQKPERKETFYNHVLAVNDVLIALERFAAASGGAVVINALTHDLYLRRNPMLVALGEGREIRLSGDGYVDLVAYGYCLPLWLELDMGTEHQSVWKAKVEAIVRFVETLPPPHPTVMVVTPAGSHRLQKLWQWTGEQLETMHRQQWADLFRMTAAVVTDRSPHELFVWPIWSRPFDSELLPLIEEGAP